jgi:Short C-terminal domain
MGMREEAGDERARDLREVILVGRVEERVPVALEQRQMRVYPRPPGTLDRRAVWPALFLSLGWNFLEFGLDPPGPGGLEWGWLVCAVVFFVMGGVPLAAVLPALWRRLTGRTSPSRLREMPLPRRARSAASTGSGSSRWIGWEAASATTAATSTTAAPTPDRPGDLVTSLERLDELHRSGALDDDEYDAAKRRILEAGGS